MKNLADSVLARLRNFAKARNLIYNEVLMRYILKRIFYRVGASEHAGKLILKGGNLFVFWQNGFDFRPTMDADMLFRGESSPERLKEIFTEICMEESVDDGVRIDIKSIKAEQILEETEYGGIRITFNACIGQTRTPVQIDIGVGDAVTPAARKAEYPTLLDFPAPSIRMYPPETVIAEKFEALVKRGILTSRMKDIYDIWKLKSLFEFDGKVLGEAIFKTFKRRNRTIPVNPPVIFTPEFHESKLKQKQWTAFLRKSRLDVGDKSLSDIIAEIAEFLMPLLKKCRSSDI